MTFTSTVCRRMFWTSAQMVDGKLAQHWKGESLQQLMIFITLGALQTVYNITC